MKKKEFKEAFIEFFSNDVEELTDLEKSVLVKSYLHEYERNKAFDESNKGKPWADEELRVVFSFAPNKENILKVAKAFRRGYGSIEQIYRWAATSDKDINEKDRQDDKFIRQIKRIAKESGWRI